jgi:DNA-binding transcriptional ArsR family regulator
MEERLKILKLLEEGKITSDEAGKLLDALGTKKSEKARWLKVRVYDAGSSKPKVNVNVPLSLMKIALKMGGKFSFAIPKKAKEALKEKGIDLESSTEDVLKSLGQLEEGFPLVDVVDDESGERVEVYVE